VSENRPHPPSPRRLAEARRAGRIAWSPVLVGGAAIAGGAAALAAVGAAWLDEAGRGLAAGARASGAEDPIAAVSGLRAGDVIADLAALAAPLLVLAAAAALVAHLAQTRGLWIPRRRSRSLPPPDPRRAATFGFALARAAAVALVAGSAVVSAAATLAAHAGHTAAATGALYATLAAVVLAHGAAAAVALGAIDWLERTRRLHADLAMSPRELRDERRETEADPRWRRARAAPADDDAIRTALVLVVSDDVAAALAWHPRWQPLPLITTAARGRGALRLTALARRHAIPIHRDPALADQLAPLANRPAPDHLHPALARLIAAVT
jgi:flagellar biosynthetic protein FlhB